MKGDSVRGVPDRAGCLSPTLHARPCRPGKLGASQSLSLGKDLPEPWERVQGRGGGRACAQEPAGDARSGSRCGRRGRLVTVRLSARVCGEGGLGGHGKAAAVGRAPEDEAGGERQVLTGARGVCVRRPPCVGLRFSSDVWWPLRWPPGGLEVLGGLGTGLRPAVPSVSPGPRCQLTPRVHQDSRHRRGGIKGPLGEGTVLY